MGLSTIGDGQMQIEAGKYYRTRDGRKVGPMITDGRLAKTPDDSEYTCVYKNTGRGNGIDGEDWEGDIVAEWSDGPVRTETVTKRRIVPGVYGILSVRPNGYCSLNPKARAYYTPDELDAAARVLSELAEALRDGLD